MSQPLSYAAQDGRLADAADALRRRVHEETW